MTVALVMVARDEEPVVRRALESARPFVDSWLLLDTGSVDRTPEVTEEVMDGLPGRVVRLPWGGFAQARTHALRLAQGQADWLLQMDADMSLEVQHPGMRDWLASDPDPGVTAWEIPIVDRGLVWRLPWLVRGDRRWVYEGEAHAYQVRQGRQRPLLGMWIHHHGEYKPGRFEDNLAALAPGVDAGDPRSVYYTAQALRALGRTDEAIAMYNRRANMGGFEEEAWHAQYMAAREAQDVEGLLAAYRRRPWRHEPLTWAARFAGQQDPGSDLLFLETVGG